MTFPTTATFAGGSFQAVISFPATITFPAQEEEPTSPLDVANVEKLSLPTNTEVGTQVAVSDGFYVVAGNGSGFYSKRGTFGSRPWSFYNLANKPTTDPALVTPEYCVFKDEDEWFVQASGGQNYYSTNDDPNTAIEPWEPQNWILGDIGVNPVPVLTYPALQQLVVPSVAQGGLFMAGGGQDGVYTIIGTSNDRPLYKLLGFTGDGIAVVWNIDRWSVINADPDNAYYSLSDVATPDLAGTDKTVMTVSGVSYSKRGTNGGKPYYNKIGETNSITLNAIVWTAAVWHVTNAIGADLDTSANDVATPDLATFLLGTLVTNTAWLNASDDTSASITVTSVTQGELDAGIRIGDDPESTYQANGIENGRNKFIDVITGSRESISWDGTKWQREGTGLNFDNVAFPWQGTAEGITRDDVASEPNWEAVP